jgi:hypothetical protein
MSHTKATKIFWKKEEREIVADKAYELILSGAEKSWVGAIMVAQNLVIEDASRRRSKSGLTGQTQKDMRVLALQRAEAKEAKDSAERLQKEFVVAQKTPDTPPTSVATEPDQETEIPDSYRWMHAYAKRIANHFKEALVEELLKATDEAMKVAEQQFHKHIQHAKGIAHKVAVKKPRVLICGMIASQEQAVRDDFDELFDLTFFKSDENLQQLKKMLQVDHIILMTGKISHQIQAITRQHPSLHMVGGGVSMIKDKLLKLACA